MNKDDMSPWQIIKKQKPEMSIELARLPDWLSPDYVTKEELLLRGYDVPCYPYFLNFAKNSTDRHGLLTD